MNWLYVVLICLGSFIIILFALMVILERPNKKRDTSYFKGKMYAHRGLHDDEVPENSLTAFRLAKEAGYGVELDVQMTKDKQLVVFHDGDLKRMCGVDGKLRDFTYEELSGFKLKETDEHIPLFSEVLKVLDGADLICEIKADNGMKNYELCRLVYDMLMTYKGKFCMESFSPYITGWFKNNHPEIIRGQLSENFVKSMGFNPIHFFLTELMVNVISRPDFVAYNHYHKSLGWHLERLFYRPLWVAWTARGDAEIQSAKRRYDSVIFEKNPPKERK